MASIEGVAIGRWIVAIEYVGAIVHMQPGEVDGIRCGTQPEMLN